MVVTATTEATPQAQGGLRPMDPSRDMRAIADLIAEAFAQELDERSRAALREMRWMARLSPLVWWLSEADPSFRDTFNGFVWEDAPAPGVKKQILGNVSLNRAPGNRQRWIICNVVVQSKYRGQGIGRELTEAAIAEAESMGAQGSVIQVYQDNPTAWRLYRGLGFWEVAGQTDLWLEAPEAVAVLDAPGYQLGPWRPADGQAAYELAQSVTPTVLQWIRPVRASHFRKSWSARLAERITGLLTGHRVYRLTARKGTRLVGVLTMTAVFRQGEHRLALMVHPDYGGQLEAPLLSRALYMLAGLPPRPVKVTAYKADTPVLEVLRGYGFREQRTMLTLRKDFA
jgi:ribosomal protein S18 acetylase RimI-like enzyme